MKKQMPLSPLCRAARRQKTVQKTVWKTVQKTVQKTVWKTVTARRCHLQCQVSWWCDQLRSITGCDQLRSITGWSGGGRHIATSCRLAKTFLECVLFKDQRNSCKGCLAASSCLQAWLQACLQAWPPAPSCRLTRTFLECVRFQSHKNVLPFSAPQAQQTPCIRGQTPCRVALKHCLSRV